MRISRSEPIATSKRVTNAAPLRHKFSLEVSSSKVTPRRSRPRTFRGRRTAILRSDLCLDGELSWTMRGGLFFLDRWAVSCIGDRETISGAGDCRAIDFARCRAAVRGSCDRKTVLVMRDRRAVDVIPYRGGSLREKLFHAFEHFAGRSRRVYDSTKLAAVPHAMCEPARELLHFAYAIGQLRSVYLLVVAGE